MTPSKPTVPVSGRVPALPEDMVEKGARGLYDYPRDPDVIELARSAMVLAAAGVPGLVQRLTEAEEERDQLRERYDAVRHAYACEAQARALAEARVEEAERLLRGARALIDPWREIKIAEIDAFLSVGEGRSREPDGGGEC